MEIERKPLMCRVKKMFLLQKSEQEKCSINPVLGHGSECTQAACPRLEGGPGGVVTRSSLPLSNLCASWLGCNVLCKC